MHFPWTPDCYWWHWHHEQSVELTSLPWKNLGTNWKGWERWYLTPLTWRHYSGMYQNPGIRSHKWSEWSHTHRIKSKSILRHTKQILVPSKYLSKPEQPLWLKPDLTNPYSWESQHEAHLIHVSTPTIMEWDQDPVRLTQSNATTVVEMVTPHLNAIHMVVD